VKHDRTCTAPTLAGMLRVMGMAAPHWSDVLDDAAERLCAHAARAKAARPGAHTVRTGCAHGAHSAPEEGGLGGGGVNAKEPLVSQKRGSEAKDQQIHPEVRAEVGKASAHGVRTDVPLPDSLNTPAFAPTWALWKADRKARRKTMTPHAEQLQLKRLAKYPPEQAASILVTAIEKGWTGPVYPEENTNGRKPLPDHRAAKAAREYDEPDLLSTLPVYRPPSSGSRPGSGGSGAAPGAAAG
jgi:hypothetical protein